MAFLYCGVASNNTKQQKEDFSLKRLQTILCDRVTLLSFVPPRSVFLQTSRCRAKQCVYSLSTFLPPIFLTDPLSVSPCPPKCQPSHLLLSKALQSQQDPPKPDCSSHIIQLHTKTSEDRGTMKKKFFLKVFETHDRFNITCVVIWFSVILWLSVM